MQPNNTSDTRAQNVEHAKTEIERDLATSAAVSLAQENNTLSQQRDHAVNVAGQAVNVAVVETDQRLRAEQDALSARMREGQAQQEAGRLSTERSLMRENLASERESASNANFGFIFLTCIVLAALIGLGVWYYTSNGTQPSSASNSGTPPVEKPITVNVQSPPVIHESAPPVIIKQPAPIVITTPPAKSENTDKTEDTPSSEKTDEKSDTSEPGGETAPPPDTSNNNQNGSPPGETKSDGSSGG